MSRKVGDRQHLVAQRRHEQQVHLREDARHLDRHASPEAVGLHKVDCREKARFAEQVGPRVRNLRLELRSLTTEGEFLERSRRLAEQHMVERAIRPVGNGHLGRNHLQRADRGERGAIDVGGRVLLHPFREIAHAQSGDACASVVVQLAGDARHIARVRPRDRVQHQHRVLDRTRHGAKLVERPAERHRPRARHATVCGAQAGNATAHGGTHNAPAGFAADGKGDEAGRRRGTGPGARAGRAFLEKPRVHGLAAEPDVIERERAKAELCDQDRASVLQAFHHRGVGGRHAIPEWLGAPCGRDVGGVEQILHAKRNAVQRAAVLALRDLGVGLFCLGQGNVARERDDAMELLVELGDSCQVDICQALGAQLAMLDPARELRDRGKGDVIVARGERPGVARAAHEPVARRPDALAREVGIPPRGGRQVRRQRDLLGAGATFDEPRHRRPPARCGHVAFGGGHRHLRELLRFGER